MNTLNAPTSQVVFASAEYNAHLDCYKSGPDKTLVLRLPNARPASRVILKDLAAAWAALRKRVVAPVYCIGAADDGAHRKLMKALGFTRAENLRCVDGVTRQLFVHTEREQKI